MNLTSNFPPAASLNSEYSYKLQASPAGNYTFTLGLGQQLPAGLSLAANGVISGQATVKGIYKVVVVLSNGSTTKEEKITLPVLDTIELPSQLVDQGQIAAQFVEALSRQKAWSTGITSTTSQTLIELISAIGTFMTAKILRVKEDAFPETAQTDSALRAIANMQGLRLTRRLPAQVKVAFEPAAGVSIPPFTKISIAGESWFSDQPIDLTGTSDVEVYLKEGVVQESVIAGLGTDLQAWVSTAENFEVSDQDVFVYINGVPQTKVYGGLWNYKGQNDVCTDTTLPSGACVIQFGRLNFGAVPSATDIVKIVYATTKGAEVNGKGMVGAKPAVSGMPNITGQVVENPSGGAFEKDPLAYKNYASGSFGTFGSAVTGGQYEAMAKTYPGVVDAVIRAQRTINPQDLRWMNVMQLSVLTLSPWVEAQRREYIDFLQKSSMYSTRFVMTDPVPVPFDISLSVFCYNHAHSLSDVKNKIEAAILQMFAPRAGLLGTSFHHSDLIETAMNAAGGTVSYVIVNSPAKSLTVELPKVNASVSVVAGVLTPATYAYAVTATVVDPSNPSATVLVPPHQWLYHQAPDNTGAKISWAPVEGAVSYTVWGRKADKLQMLYIGTDLAYTDDGSTPDPVAPLVFSVEALAIRYAKINSLVVDVQYTDRMTQATYPIRDISK